MAELGKDPMLRLPFFGVVLACSAFGCGCQASGAGTARMQTPTPSQLLPETAVARAQAPELETPRVVKPAGYTADAKTGDALPRDGKMLSIESARVVARVNGEPILMLELISASAARLMQLS